MPRFCKCGRALAGTKLNICHACYMRKWRREHPGYATIRRKNRNGNKGRDDYKKGIHPKTPRTTTCKLIKQHHEAMKDDPEHLTTEFIKKLIKVDCKDI